MPTIDQGSRSRAPSSTRCLSRRSSTDSQGAPLKWSRSSPSPRTSPPKRGRGGRRRRPSASPSNIRRAVKVRDDVLEHVARDAARRGPHPRRGLPGRRQDRAGARALALDRLRVRARPVHGRPAARRHRRHQRLQPARGALRVPARADLRQRRARRRDQPRLAEDPVRPARVHAGAPRHRRRALARARAPVPRLRDAEPGRVRGHLPAARGAGRPLHGPALARLPDAGRRGRHARRPRVAATACSSSRPVADRAEVLDADRRRPPRARVAGAARLHRRAAAPHARRPARRARRLAARRPDAAARRQGARAGPGPRPRAARRRPGARRAPCSRTASCSCPRRRGSSAARSSPTRSPRRRRSREPRRCARRSAARRSASCCCSSPGTFDAEPLYVTGSALLLLGAGAAAWIGARRAWGASVDARDRRAQRRRGGAAAGRASRRAPAGCRCRPAGSTSRCCPSPCGCTPAAASARVRVEVTFGRRGRRVLRAARARAARPVRARPARRSPARDADEVLVLPARLPGRRDRAAGETRRPRTRARR